MSVFTPAQAAQLEAAFNEVGPIKQPGKARYLPKAVLGPLLHAVGVNSLPWEVQDMEQDIEETFDFDTFKYLVYRASRGTDPTVELLNAIRLFDGEGNGTVNKSDICSILTSLSDPYTPAEIEEVLGLLTFDEGGNVDCKSLVDVLLAL
jgi:Ca2+-binding EF-hand superfamily protein